MLIISPYAQALRNNSPTPNPKNYPFWKEVVSSLKSQSIHIIQVGVGNEEKLDVNEYCFNLPFKKLKQLLDKANTFCCVDNFFHHLVFP